MAAKRKEALAAYRDATLFKVVYAWGCGAPRRPGWMWRTGAGTRPPRSSAGMASARPLGKAVRGQPLRRRNVPWVMG